LPDKDKVERKHFDEAGYIQSWDQMEPSLSLDELRNNKFVIIVDDGVTKGHSNALSLASAPHHYAQCTFTKNEQGEENLVLLPPDRNNPCKIIDGAHLFADSEFLVIHICMPKTPIFLGDNKTAGVTERFVGQVAQLFGASVGVKLLGVMMVGLQADCKFLTKQKLAAPMTVGTVQQALTRKMKELAAGWNEICRGESSDLPPLAVGILGVPALSLKVIEGAEAGFTSFRLVSYLTCYFLIIECLFSY
jgi:hypothetical protein